MYDGIDLADVVQLQKQYISLVQSNCLSRAALCKLVVPFRAKYGLSEEEALSVARNELTVEKLVELSNSVKSRLLTERKGITAMLSELLEKYIAPNRDNRIYWAKEVTFDYGTQNQVRVDYMRFKPRNNTVSGIESGEFYCYEVKSSVEDFHSKHGHNFIGDYNYYVMPLSVYEDVKGEIKHNIGVLCLDMENKGKGLYSVKRAKRKDRNRPVSEMLLMMFRSANRDRG